MSEALTLTVDTPENTGPSLEDTAREMGIDLNNIDETAEAQPAPEAKEKILGKFESVDALAEAYKALEKKLGSKGTEKSETPAGDPSEGQETASEEQEVEEQSDTDAAKEAAENAGLNFEELSQKYWAKGDIDPEDYEALEKSGIPKAIVDQFIRGQEALYQAAEAAVFKDVGGEDNYKSMIAWAKQNLPKEEITAYDRAVTSGNMDTVRMAVRGLHARFQADVGYEPSRRVTGDRVVVADRFESWAQVTAAMSDKRYGKDPAYTNAVAQKLGRSDL